MMPIIQCTTCDTVFPTLPVGHIGGTGYSTNRETGARYCYPCTDAMERTALKTADRFFAYLKGQAAGHDATLTTWTGGDLATVTYLNKGRHNIGGWLYRFRATDVHGAHWYGTSPGPGMYARMRRAKGGK